MLTHFPTTYTTEIRHFSAKTGQKRTKIPSKTAFSTRKHNITKCSQTTYLRHLRALNLAGAVRIELTTRGFGGGVFYLLLCLYYVSFKVIWTLMTTIWRQNYNYSCSSIISYHWLKKTINLAWREDIFQTKLILFQRMLPNVCYFKVNGLIW